MKKLLTFLTAILLCVGISQAADKIVYNDSPLPEKARTLLSKNFKAKVNFVKIDNNLLGKPDGYEAVLKDGTEVEFDADGNLTAVDAGANGVPKALILPAISQYVKNNCKNLKIVELDVNKKYYEIELQDGRELQFDRDGKFMKEIR